MHLSKLVDFLKVCASKSNRTYNFWKVQNILIINFVRYFKNVQIQKMEKYGKRRDERRKKEISNLKIIFLNIFLNIGNPFYRTL